MTSDYSDTPSNTRNDPAPSERSVMDHLTSAWNDFVSMDRDHADEVGEFRASIHALQGILATRIARRDNWQGLTSGDPAPHPQHETHA